MVATKFVSVSLLVIVTGNVNSLRVSTLSDETPMPTATVAGCHGFESASITLPTTLSGSVISVVKPLWSIAEMGVIVTAVWLTVWFSFA